SPARSGRRRGLVYAGVGALIVAAVVAALVLLRGASARSSGAKPAVSHEQRTPPAPRADAKSSPLEPLARAWGAHGQGLDPVRAGDVRERRVRTAAQFAPQNYEAGEARFAPRASPEPGVFAVEDRIRPIPPKGKTYDPRSRNTCQEVWTTAGGEPLRARGGAS